MTNQTREVLLPCSPADAAEQAARAMSAVGVLQEQSAYHLRGRIQYGIQRVPVRISWAEYSRGTRLIIQVTSPSLILSGARSAADRLELTIRSLHVPGFRPDRLGMSRMAAFGIVLLLWLVIWGLVNLVLR